MNRKDISEKIAKEANIPYAMADRIVVSVLKTIIDGVANPAEGRDPIVSLAGFGSFKTKTRKASKRRNPRTGIAIDCPEKKVVRFVPATAFKDAINPNDAK